MVKTYFIILRIQIFCFIITFQVLASNLESKINETSADDMVKKFINTSISVSKEIKSFYSLQI